MKILGYQENIPLTVLNTFSGNVESFRVYANILVWLIKCLDPDSMIHQETRSESDRVMLIRSATEFLVNIKCSFNIYSLKLIDFLFYAIKIITKIESCLQAVTSGIKLNPRKLYASNSATAKELLKVTTALLDSPKSVQLDNEQIISFEESFSNDQVLRCLLLYS